MGLQLLRPSVQCKAAPVVQGRARYLFRTFAAVRGAAMISTLTSNPFRGILEIAGWASPPHGRWGHRSPRGAHSGRRPLLRPGRASPHLSSPSDGAGGHRGESHCLARGGIFALGAEGGVGSFTFLLRQSGKPGSIGHEGGLHPLDELRCGYSQYGEIIAVRSRSRREPTLNPEVMLSKGRGFALT